MALRILFWVIVAGNAAALGLFFVLGLKFTELHLPWLQKLSQILIDRERIKSLLSASDAPAIFQVLSEAERTLAPIAFANAV